MYVSLRLKYPLCLSESNETCIFSKGLKKFLNISFHENPSSGSRVVPMRAVVRTEGRRHGEVNSRFSQFFERA